jgi:hypothetical protein
MKEEFNEEIELLNEIYSDMVDALMHKPTVEDIEKSRIYTENLLSFLNKWIIEIKNVKNSLEARQPVKDITADNRPA